MNVAVIGATSGIAEAVARRFAKEGARLFLAARNPAKLRAVADDLRVRGGGEIFVHQIDFGDFAAHDGLIAAVRERMPTLDVVLIAYGTLPDQKAIDRDPSAQIAAFTLNATSVISIGSRFASLFEDQKSGTLAVMGSVAGDRGRRSNYVYGSAKAAVHAWCDGVRGRLERAGAAVVLIKPGRIDTAMTTHLAKGPLVVSADAAGAAIHAAIMRRERVAYIPSWWRAISFVFKMMPSSILARVSF